MILDALVDQFVQRFQYEKRAPVCLWFDERREFVRLLPTLRAHLAEMAQSPFQLLQYDEEQGQGQIWLKYQIWRSWRDVEPGEQKRGRFVVYVPLSEDRLEEAGPDGEGPLDLLTEYRLAGTLWRVNGKRPKLFSFLRQVGVALPEAPSEQRWLYEGGADSLLAKYVAKFVDRPADFWSVTLTSDVAQSSLIGDTDQTILDLAVDPGGTWKRLLDDGLLREFLSIIGSHYGFEASSESPDDWVRELVATLALTETFLGYGEPGDFPFADRLPPEPPRPHYVQLLQRWLRDIESRGAWDRWVREIETEVDLSKWARGRCGRSYGLPHLVRHRWNEIRDRFEEAAAKDSATSDFFEHHFESIAKEAEFGAASHVPIGEWSLLRDLGVFLRACREAEARVGKLVTVTEFARLYVDSAAAIELQHVQIRARAEEHSFISVIQVADRAYADYADALNARFFRAFEAAGLTAVPEFPEVTAHLEESLWHASGRRAVIIVDGLRYDCALAIKDGLREQDVVVEPVIATLPTVTPIGMTALLPLSGVEVGLQVKGNNLHPIIDGKDSSVVANRMSYLSRTGAVCIHIGEAESASDPPQGCGELLVVFGHNNIDHLGHGEAQTLIRHVQREVERLTRLVRKLHRWDYNSVHVITDHGFILVDESRLPAEVVCDKEWCRVYKERFAVVPATADLPVATFPFRWDDAIKVAVPPGLAFFKAEKSFSHGGAALQEIVIPHLTSKSRAPSEKRIGVEVVLPTYKLTRTAVKVILRPQSRGVSTTGQMILFAAIGRTLTIDVLQTETTGKRTSVLATGPKEVRLEPTDREQAVTLFFHTATSFQKEELLDLEIRDVETTEQIPPGGIKLTVARDM